MQREGDATVRWRTALVVAATDFDVNILVERSRKSIAGCRQDAPSTSGLGRVHDGSRIRGVAQTEERKRLEAPIEHHNSRGSAALRDVVGGRSTGVGSEHGLNPNG